MCGKMSGVSRIFLAADASQPLSEAAHRALTAALATAWADPTLRPHEGQVAATVARAADQAVATAVGAPGAHVRWYSSMADAFAAGTEALGGPVALAATERLVLLDTVAKLPMSPMVLPVDATGRLDPDAVARALPDAAACAVAVGNPEVGTRQPIGAIAGHCAEYGVPLLVDATMAAGRTPLPEVWDMLVLDAASWAGGPGCAAVVVRDGSVLPEGAPAPSIPVRAAAALALEDAVSKVAERAAHDAGLTARLRSRLAEMPLVQVHGAADPLPHVVGFSALYVDAEALVLELDRAGIAVASGSACAAGDGEPSHVLAAMGALTSGNVRITLPLDTPGAHIDQLLAVLPDAIDRLRLEVGL